MLRKLGFAVVTVFLAPFGLHLQVYSVLVVALLALLAHDNVRPYAQGTANVADQGSLIVTILTMLGGLYLGEETLSTSARTVVTACVVGANALFLLVLTVLIIRLRLIRGGAANNVDASFADTEPLSKPGSNKRTSARKSIAQQLHIVGTAVGQKLRRFSAMGVPITSNPMLVTAGRQSENDTGKSAVMAPPQAVRRSARDPVLSAGRNTDSPQPNVVHFDAKRASAALAMSRGSRPALPSRRMGGRKA